MRLVDDDGPHARRRAALYIGPPKTKRAWRTVSLPDDLVDVLLPLVAGRAPDALLFTNTIGSRLSSSRFWTTTWTHLLFVHKLARGQQQ